MAGLQMLVDIKDLISTLIKKQDESDKKLDEVQKIVLEIGNKVSQCATKMKELSVKQARLEAATKLIYGKIADTVYIFPINSLEAFFQLEKEVVEDGTRRATVEAELRKIIRQNDEFWLEKVIEVELLNEFTVQKIIGKHSLLDSAVIKYSMKWLKCSNSALSIQLRKLKDRNYKRQKNVKRKEQEGEEVGEVMDMAKQSSAVVNEEITKMLVEEVNYEY
ncbi:uncharacterized protein LOC129800832 isoform X2 [Phlebotomus papatasi]|uniref:uncharacterized protein LOC129799028 isoform X2 n=1 Tax=Phlebotomus papatasi TaxID=29031 RepID=UPI002483FB46|nr:uncharacterized protein LOC129799028 isoform X2 [Phlebotomus papatasi]XP_055701482.1 uncharacterized protein LOC129800832 isoform X2 [Phlebotomus papatasi]